ncbi:hypothetical protein [Stieleria varia]|uniref:hypothetical protein n=1 Tax=Stieleria varia TaxID=2528005 RepID=UPI0011B364F9|nr:hypothetical protein [Stieleria varia]
MRINLQSIILTTLLGMPILSGCASLQDYSYEQKQRMRASAQFRECGKANCSNYPHDYKRGWKDGFYAVATGDSSCPPAIAPACYWDPDQILDDCDNRRHAYYSGWQDGASRASQFPDTHYLRIYETCECPFPRCEESCLGGTCGCVPGGLMMDEGFVETEMPIVDMPVDMQMESMPMPPAPVVEKSPVDKPAKTSAAKAKVDAEDSAPMPAPKVNKKKPTEDLPVPKAEKDTLPKPSNDESAAQYNFGDDGGIVIDFTGEGEAGSPSDARSGVVTGTVADFDFTFGDEDLGGFGLIETEED